MGCHTQAMSAIGVKRMSGNMWNYRVLESVGADGAKYQQIHEVYYTNKELSFYTANPSGVMWSSEESGEDVLRQMAEALTKPVLTAADFHT